MAGQLRRVGWWLLAAWFVVISATWILGPATRGNSLWFGWDAVVYTQAARDLLAGADPWATQVFSINFAGPPTSLLPFLPFVALPDSIVAGVWVAIGFASSLYSIRRLSLPMWWLAFPPVVIGIAAGSSAPLVLALVVKAGFADRMFRVEPAEGEQSAGEGAAVDGAVIEGTAAEHPETAAPGPVRLLPVDGDFGVLLTRRVAAGAAAILIRPYVALPAILLARWRTLILAAVAVVVTAPFLAWPSFFHDLPQIQQALVNQASGGLSAAGSPLLIVLAVTGMFALGRRRAAWLIVPALWPNTQLYYASLALPVLAEMPLVALAIASPATPGLIALGIYAQAVWERLSRREIGRRWVPDALLARLERRAAQAQAPAAASGRARE
jgi:hypothetical protein